jgi:hypothetical protein
MELIERAILEFEEGYDPLREAALNRIAALHRQSEGEDFRPDDSLSKPKFHDALDRSISRFRKVQALTAPLGVKIPSLTRYVDAECGLCELLIKAEEDLNLFDHSRAVTLLLLFSNRADEVVDALGKLHAQQVSIDDVDS